MFTKSHRLLFYRDRKDRPLVNPIRRWIPLYFVCSCLGLGTVYGGIEYYLAGREARRYGDDKGNHLCGHAAIDILHMLPLNMLSRCAGYWAGSDVLPQYVHEQLIKALVWLYKIPLEEESATSSFSTLQAFYVRRWKPEARPIHPTAPLVSPCDGEVLSVREVNGDSVVQVKGLSYPLYSLFHLRPPPPSQGRRRVLVVIRLGMGDFHRVIAPCAFSCEESIYIPGAVLPVNPAWYHMIPGLLSFNERVVVHGRRADDTTSPLHLALVGSTLTGHIRLAFDGLVRTNFPDPPEYAVSTKYKQTLEVRKGGPVGAFYWGSTVALLTDIPQSATLLVKAGGRIKAGAPLMTKE